MTDSGGRLLRPTSSLTPITHTASDFNRRDQLLHQSQPSSSSILVPISEAEYIVRSLQSFPIHEIGCTPFLRMYGYDVERLSMQAHISAQRQDGDEYIVDALLTYGKVSTLVKTLLAIEAWRSFVLLGSDASETGTENGNGTDINDHCGGGGDVDVVVNVEGNENRGDSDEKMPTPTLAERLAENKSSLRCAFILHVETTLVSLLNLIIYKRENCAELESDVAITLVDYCARQMSSLAAPLSQNKMLRRQKQPGTMEEIMARTTQRIQAASLLVEELHDNLLESRYKTAVVATSLARHLCEHLDSLPLGAQTRIMDTHDYLIMIIPLIDEPPWTRRRRKRRTRQRQENTNDHHDNDEKKNPEKCKHGNHDECVTEGPMEMEYVHVWEKLHNNREWKEVPPTELLHLTQCEAQCWLAVFHLTCGNKACRERYTWNVFRKEQLLKLRKYLHEVMLDQLPVLTDVMRYMDELTLMDVPDVSTGQGAALLLQQVDTLREEIISGSCSTTSCSGRDYWNDMAKTQYEHIFSKFTDSTDEDLRLIAEIYNEDGLVSALDASEGHHDLVDEPFDPMTAPLKIVQLKDGDQDLYNLTPCDDGQVVQTEYGAFRRTKLKLHPAAITSLDEEEEDKPPHLFPNTLTLKVIVSFEGFDRFKTLTYNASPFEDGSSTIQWVQVGTAEEKLVLQLGFKKLSSEQCDGCENMYELRQTFLSQPALE